MKQRVLLLCGLKLRDLPYLVMLKLLLKKRGIHSDILSISANPRLIKHYPADLVVMPHLGSKGFADFCLYKKKHRSIICVIPTEQFSKKEIYIEASYRAYKDYIKVVDLYFVWSEKSKELLVKNNILNDNQIKAVGCPRFDFYSPEFANKLCNKEEICRKYRLDQNKKIITWATGYSWSDLDEEHAINSIKGAGSDKFVDPKKIIEMDREARQTTSDAFFSVVKKFKDVQFVVKMHPCELNPSIYLNKIKELCLENAVVLKNANLLELIYISDLWIHWNSTTSIEAGVMNKPALNMSIGIAQEHQYDNLIKASIDDIHSTKELEKYINQVLRNENLLTKKSAKAREKFIEEWIGISDGKSIERHAEEIIKLLNDKKQSLSIANRFNIPYLLIKAYDLFKVFFGIEMHESLFKPTPNYKEWDENKFFTRKEAKEMERTYKKLID